MKEHAEFDLDADAREALELDAVLDYAATYALTVPGRVRVRALRPIASAAALHAERGAVAEAIGYRERHGAILPPGIPDPTPARTALAVTDLTVEPIPLRDLASTLLEAADLRRRLTGGDLSGFDRLEAVGRAIPDLSTLAREVARHIAPDGTIEDAASPELRRIRVAIGKTGERLRRQLESFISDPGAASLIRDEFVTQRNGRYVIPVRADAPRPVEGIVHAASSSGQTLFVEPIESVALNNDLVRLADQEAEERARVLRGWSERFRAKVDDIDAAIGGLTRADELQAKTVFAEAIGGCLPTFAQDGPLRLTGVRHPLLDRRLREHGGRCVPLTIEIEPDRRVLVISGPNTGGKTVALKTVGLACLMGQCGLPVAADEATLPVFRQLRADIGDHQSIDADLSTFSAHVRAVARCLEQARPPALFLFDEIGTGTEPGEGAALGRAVLERLLTIGATGIATTHHAALKTWAFEDTRVGSAAMEFDEATLQPTYRVISGAAGTSAGIDIAARLGLPAAIVERARELAGSGRIDTERYMTRLRDATADAEMRAAALARDQDDLARTRKQVEERAHDQSMRLKEEARAALSSALTEFHQISRKEIAELRDAGVRAQLERAQLRSEKRLRALASAKQDTIAPGARGAERAPASMSPGTAVRIVSLDREGAIVAVRGDRVDVRMGSATFTVLKSDLAAVGPSEPSRLAAPPKPVKPSRLAALAAARTEASSEPVLEDLPAELHLLGKTVDEAIPSVDRFLDASTRLGRGEVRIVHGHGTGRLKMAVRKHLKGHPQVESFRPGGPGEGGDGATVVTLG